MTKCHAADEQLFCHRTYARSVKYCNCKCSLTMCITSCLCVCRTAAFLMKHLAYMSMHDAKTGMNSKNLAIVWAPNLLKYFCPRLLHNVFSCDKTIRMLFCWQVLKKLHAFTLCQLFWLLQFCCSCINGVMMDAF